MARTTAHSLTSVRDGPAPYSWGMIFSENRYPSPIGVEDMLFGIMLCPENAMAWVILFFAGLSEVGWAVGLKYTEGFTRLVPSVLTLGSMAVSLGLLGLALKTLPLGTAYAVWTGIGTIGTALLGITLFGESASALRLACIGLIVAGIVGLKLVSAE
jgi:quaternary ammonium compound-resistance protein SugE